MARIEFNHPKIRQAASSGIVDEGYLKPIFAIRCSTMPRRGSLRSTDVPKQRRGGPWPIGRQLPCAGEPDRLHNQLRRPADRWRPGARLDVARIAMADGVAPIAIEVSGAQDGPSTPAIRSCSTVRRSTINILIQTYIGYTKTTSLACAGASGCHPRCSGSDPWQLQKHCAHGWATPLISPRVPAERRTTTGTGTTCKPPPARSVRASLPRSITSPRVCRMRNCASCCMATLRPPSTRCACWSISATRCCSPTGPLCRRFHRNVFPAQLPAGGDEYDHL